MKKPTLVHGPLASSDNLSMYVSYIHVILIFFFGRCFSFTRRPPTTILINLSLDLNLFFTLQPFCTHHIHCWFQCIRKCYNVVGQNGAVFQYSSMHSFLEVTKANFDSCQASSPLKSYNGGKTAILLDSRGKRYFILGTAGHCDPGMKLEVNVVAPASSSPSSSPTTVLPKRRLPLLWILPRQGRLPRHVKRPYASPSGSPSDGSASSPPASGSPMGPPSSTHGFAPASASSKAAGGFFSNKIVVVIGFGLFALRAFNVSEGY